MEDQDLDSFVSTGQSCTALEPFIGSSLMELHQGEEVGPAFQAGAQAVQKKGGSDTANVICGLYLAPEAHLIEWVKVAPIDEDGLSHLVLCRVILGKSKLIHFGSEQCHPSSEQYDSSVDDLSSPRRYIIWSTHMATHALPEYLISFRTPRYLRELSRDPEMSRQPTSPWIPLSVLMAELSKMFTPSELRLILDYHNDYQAERISRAMMVHRVRQIIGDSLLIKMINTLEQFEP